MDATIDAGHPARVAVWVSYIASAIPVFFMVMSATFKFFPSMVGDGFEHLGWPVSSALPLAIVELGCVVIYLIPRTAVLGAILMTGYLGGATATHARIGEAAFIMPALLGVFAWFGLWLREPRLKTLLPLRS